MRVRGGRHDHRARRRGASRGSSAMLLAVLCIAALMLLAINPGGVTSRIAAGVGIDGGRSAQGDGASLGDTSQVAGEGAAAQQEDQPEADPSATTRMDENQRLHGDIAPKSIVANRHGLLIANNMMYRHSSTLYDAEGMELVATVADDVDLAAHGFPAERSGTTQGAPVEAAWTDDGRYAYVSQYGLSGPGSGAASTDACTEGEQIGKSAVFRLDTHTMAWDQVIEVGRVPKFITLSDDGSIALVSNWCDRDVSVVDLEAGEEIRTIPVDSAPRGSVILPDNRTAYVAAMYADELFRVDLVTGESELVLETGRKPRHLVLSPDRTRMYLTEAGSDRLVVLDPETGEVIDTADTGREPRSMAISEDGTALYVVNYYGNSVSKFDALTLEELQREPTGESPVGVAYEPTQQRVWVANYQGSLDIFDDTRPATEETSEETDSQEGGE